MKYEAAVEKWLNEKHGISLEKDDAVTDIEFEVYKSRGCPTCDHGSETDITAYVRTEKYRSYYVDVDSISDMMKEIIEVGFS